MSGEFVPVTVTVPPSEPAQTPSGTPVDLDKMRSIGVISRRSGDRVVEGRRDGVRVKSTTDELGNTVTEHASKDDRVDVNIRAPRVAVTASVNEERD